MGLACSQVVLLSLTRRKADCELDITIGHNDKMALTREMTSLSQEYNRRLQAKRISYYNDGKYRDVSYSYLMGFGKDTLKRVNEGNPVLKSDCSMVLTDYTGRVVLDGAYAAAITDVLGVGILDEKGRGGTFSKERIAEILHRLIVESNPNDIQAIIDGEEDAVNYSLKKNVVDSSSGTKTGNAVVDNASEGTKAYLNQVRNAVLVLYPIIVAAASNGWTTEYNRDMALNDSYISDALLTGTFQLTSVDEEGVYDPATSIDYYIMTGTLETNSSSDVREEITAWYNEAKNDITEKETMLDLRLDELSTELEAIKAEIQSVESLVQDGIKDLEWGG